MERSANTKPAAAEDEEEEDYAALIYQESQRRKAEAAALAAAAGKNKKKSSTSKTVRGTSTRISTTAAGDGSSMDIVSRGKAAAATRKRKPSAGIHNGDDRAPKKVARKQYRYYECSAEGCKKAAQQGGVCVRHGAKVKRCSYEGCTNQVRRGGVCYRHGTKILCSSEGCTNHTVKAAKDVQIKLGEVECALRMEQTTNDAAVVDAPIQLKSTLASVRKINDILLLFDNECQRRKNDVALAAAVSKEKSSTSNNGSNRGTSPKISAALVVAHLFRGLQEETKQLQLRGGENHVKIYTMKMSGLQRKLLDISIVLQAWREETISREGCTNHVHNGGVCVRYGAIDTIQQVMFNRGKRGEDYAKAKEKATTIKGEASESNALPCKQHAEKGGRAVAESTTYMSSGAKQPSSRSITAETNY
eukprot:scaffold20375_cov90-Skeletonema_dohrnii-CCMP3373.AAC.2